MADSRMTALSTAAIVLIGLAPVVHADVDPFVEDFDAGPANWRDVGGVDDLDWSASGGPDGGAFAFTDFNFVDNQEGDSQILFRGHDEFNSSNNAFVGNWFDKSVSEFSFFVRHDAPFPLTYFTRFASPANFPGAIAVKFTPVLPNQWTEIIFDIDPDNPEFVSFEGTDFETVFSNIGHLQIGVSVSEELAGFDRSLTFDLDKVQVVPAPAALALLAGAGLTMRRRRRST